MTLAFTEAFGPTIQGEGPQAGRCASFVRFGACNLSCSWCDSAYTWDAGRYDLREQIQMLEPYEVASAIPIAPMLVITGGEPLLQQKREGWPAFLFYAERRFPFIAVETNGTIEPTRETILAVDQFVVSPKLSSVAMLQGKRAPRRPGDWWAHLLGEGMPVDFKIVVSEPADVEEALHIADTAGIPRHRTWLMPEGVTAAALAERWEWVAPAAAKAGVNASHRLHTLVWGEKRGH